MLELKRKELGLQERLTNETFKFDKRYGEGYFSASYFLKTEKIIKENIDYIYNYILQLFIQKINAHISTKRVK